MSVLIKGLKTPMPKRCWDCRFMDLQTGKCYADGSVRGMAGGYKRPADCPMFPIPDHGDLIDRDKLMKGLRDYACKPCKEYGADKNGDRCAWCSFDDAFARIEKAKKVIPAERSE